VHVSHVILRVADLDRAVEFYRDRVGLQVLGRSEAFAFLDAGTIRVALNQVPSHEADTSQTEVVLEVDDPAATFETLHARDVPFQVPLREVTRDGDRALHAAHFADLDGHLWSITGWIDAAE
jgi:catechol 2,3-dioxygenase-like lactoylglutathione lyase family enzyme